MQLSNFREEDRRSCILKILENTKQKDQQFQLWKQGQRILYNFSLSSLSPILRTAKFLNKGSAVFDVKPNEVIFFYEKATQMIFKSVCNFQSQAEIGIDLPETLKCKDFRLKPRKTYGFNEKKISFQMVYNGKTIDYKKQLLDVSEEGISFLINSEELRLFYPRDKIQILDDSFDKSKAYILYVERYFNGRFYSSNQFRIGAKFMS